MAKEIIYLTAEGYKKLKDDLDHMRSVERPAISAAIAEARDKGDLSENAEYDAAREAQGLLEMRIAKLEETIANARVIDESKIDKSKVQILAGDAVEPYQREADVLHDRIGKRSEPARGQTRHRYAHCQGASGQEEGRSGGRGGSRRYDPLRNSGYFDLTLRFSRLLRGRPSGRPRRFCGTGRRRRAAGRRACCVGCGGRAMRGVPSPRRKAP